MLIRALRRCVLAGAAGLMLAGGGVAAAEPTEPSELEQPRPLIGAAASCHDGVADVKVFVYDDRDEPFEVRLAGIGGSFSANNMTELDEEALVHVTVFDTVPVGEYAVAVTEETEGPADGVRVAVKPCDDPTAGDDPLKIEVECKAGWGIVTFQVTNPKTGETSSYTLSFEGAERYVIELSPGVFVRVTENGFEDNRYIARLTGDGVDVTEEFTVACASGHAPRLDIGSTCSGTQGSVSVGVLNPNRKPITYDVTIKELTQTVTVAGGERGTVTFADVPDGDHPVVVTGLDQPEAVGVAVVDCGGTTTTTTTTTTTSTTTTTTTTPVPQGRSGGGLARTGSAVGELVGLGALALLAGGALLVVARRRRAGQS